MFLPDIRRKKVPYLVPGNIPRLVTGDDEHGTAEVQVVADCGELAEHVMAYHDVAGELHPFGFLENFIFQYFYAIPAHSDQK